QEETMTKFRSRWSAPAALALMLAGTAHAVELETGVLRVEPNQLVTWHSDALREDPAGPDRRTGRRLQWIGPQSADLFPRRPSSAVRHREGWRNDALRLLQGHREQQEHRARSDPEPRDREHRGSPVDRPRSGGPCSKGRSDPC